jgi:Holliday junction resolvase
MGKASRDKGLRRERAIVQLHTACGLRAERVPLSGALRYQGNGADVDLYVRGAEPLKAEVKARGEGSGFKTLERWLGANDALFLVRDRAEPLVVVRLHVWLEIASRSARLDPDADAARRDRRSAIEQGPLPPTDAIARSAA